MRNQLLLPESTTELRLKNHSSWIKSVGIRQVEKTNIYGIGAKPSFLMGYDPIKPPKIGELMSVLTIWGMAMYDCRGRIIEPDTLYIRRPTMPDPNMDLLEMAKYYNCQIEEENAENMAKWQEKIKKWREPIPVDRHIKFATISSELNKKLMNYFKAYDFAWKSILKRNGL